MPFRISIVFFFGGGENAGIFCCFFSSLQFGNIVFAVFFCWPNRFLFFCQNHFMNMVKLKRSTGGCFSHVRSAGIWSLWPHQTPLKERGDEGAWEHKLPGPNWVLTIQIHCGVCYTSARCCRLDRKNQQHGRVHLGRSALILGTFLFLWVQHQWDSNPSIWHNILTTSKWQACLYNFSRTQERTSRSGHSPKKSTPQIQHRP